MGETISDIRSVSSSYLGTLHSALETLEMAKLAECASLLMACEKAGGAVYVCGNGGSASTASHFYNDMQVTLAKHGIRGPQVFCLCDNVAAITAMGNDLGFAEIFLFPLLDRLRKEDVLLLISCSGNSPNIVKAARYAKTKNAKIIGMTGFDGGDLYRLADCKLHIPVTDIQVVEDVHLTLCHMLMRLIGAKQRKANSISHA